jgi:hypothetical protein
MFQGDTVLQRATPIGPVIGKEKRRKRQNGGESEMEAWLHAEKRGTARSKGRTKRQRVFHPVLTGINPS